jgi:hypothetical protein
MADVSRNLVALLLVLVIIASAVGTWSVFSARRGVSYETGAPVGDASGMVVLAVPVRPSGQADVRLSIEPAPVLAVTTSPEVARG